MNLSLGRLRIGKVDGKHEYLTPVEERDFIVYDAFMLPEAVQPERMYNGDVFFLEGFRGTGKTSLLRWHAEDRRRAGCLTDFVLFKTDLNESQRLHISKEVGVSWADIDSARMEIAQDFKSAWTWFIVHKFGEILKSNPGVILPDSVSVVDRVLRLLGMQDENVFKKAMGFMPRLDGATIKIRADGGFFEAELGANIVKAGGNVETTLHAINMRIIELLSSIKLKNPIFIYFDELEAFYHTPEQHRRDQSMVRDLLFAVDILNVRFHKAGATLNTLAAVRSEVLASMGALGQEVDRLVHDRGFHIAWHYANRSMMHPLMQIIRRKLEASERAEGLSENKTDIFQRYFPKQINGEPIEVFMLDRSFYKPRDVVWRLSLAQKFFATESFFSEKVLIETEREYSGKLWDEVRYELSATYSEMEVNAIEGIFTGGATAFELDDIEAKVGERAKASSVLRQLLERRSVTDILHDLYRLGAIGNSFRAGTTGNIPRSRWAFRGDPSLLPDKRMVLHSALVKRLSAVAARRRGKRAGNR